MLYDEDSDENSYDLIPTDSRFPTKRESSLPLERAQRPPRNLSSRDHFYGFIIDILQSMKDSTRRDIRTAREREYQRKSIIA